MKRTTFMLLSAIALLLVWGSLSAQQKQITGVVLDENHNPLPGASVLEAGTSNGTTTDAKGQFTLSVTSTNDTIKVSFIGYNSQNVSIKGDKSVQVVLTPSASGLNEVVVVGYGTEKKVNLTGSVASVSGKDLSDKPVMRASAALEGLAPGVTVTQNSGKPGDDGGTIRIRGIGTLGNSNPLVLIDGIEGSLDGVDPNNIENISVLKDAASAAIYGSRAANGVILVTTKEGNRGPLKLRYNGYMGWQKFTNLPEFADGYTYMKTFNQAYMNEGKDPIFSNDYIEAYQKNWRTDPDHYPNVNWEKEAYTGSGFLQHHNINITGGSQRLKMMASLSFQDQKGVIPHYESKRYSFRVNTEMDIVKNLQVKINLAGRYSPTFAPDQTGFDNIHTQVNRIPPVYPAVLSDGRYGVAWNGQNPVAAVRSGGIDQTNYKYLLGTIQINYQPFSGAELEFNFSPQYNDAWTKNFAKTINTYNPGSDVPAYTVPKKSSLHESDSRSWQNTMHLILRYKKSFKEHNFHFLAGYEQIGYRNDNFNAFRDNFPLQDFQELNAGSIENWQNGGTASEWGLRSFFGRLNYNYAGKYLFEANLRRDGSSRFSSGNKYGIFPSFSAGWRISEETFLKNVHWLSNLKLRASWGELGNQQIGTYPYVSTINFGVNYILGGVPANGAAQLSMANQNISWEATTTKDVGIDIGVIKDKLNITYDYYIRNTTGILLQLPIPGIVGLSRPYQNAGAVKNTGWDLSVNYNNRKGDFNYSIGLNLSDVKNEVTDLKGTGPYISSYSVVEEGAPINELYGYKAIGLFQNQQQVDKSPKQFGNYGPGDIIYKDVNGDDVINADDRVKMGSQIPRYIFGLSFSGRYKGFDLSLLIQGVGKRSIFLYHDAVWAFYNAGKIQKWQLDYWTPDNPDATYPRLIAESTHNNFENSSFWVFNASYARLKNVQLGYSLPKKLISGTFIDAIRVYASGRNLFTMDHMPKGWDPERASGDAGIYAVSSTYVFGLNLTF